MVNLDINQFIMQRRTSNGVNGFCGMYSSGAMLIYSFYFSLPKIQDGHNIWLKKHISDTNWLWEHQNSLTRHL